MAKESFGMIDRLPSGNYRARYTGPDKQRHTALSTFRTKGAARVWLAERQTQIAGGLWQPPHLEALERAKKAAEASRGNQSLGAYAEQWLATRTNSHGEPLRARTVEEYERLLRVPDTHKKNDKGGPLAPLVQEKIALISPEDIRRWRAATIKTGKLTQTSRAYDLLKSILKTALEDKIITENPCQIKGGSSTSSGKAVVPPTDSELEIILDTIDVRYKALVAIAAAGGLRWGEVTAIRFKDMLIERDTAGAPLVRLRVERATVRTNVGFVVGAPKSRAGFRTVAIFGIDAQIIADYVTSSDKKSADLLFSAVKNKSSPLSQSTFNRHWTNARKAANRQDMPFHALRHYAGTRYSQSGATIKETMVRLGHSSEKAAMRYQHAGTRDDELAARVARYI